MRWLGAVAGLLGCAALASGAAAATETLEYVAFELQSEQARPGVCLSFTRSLPRAAHGLAPFVELEPASDTALVPRGKELCLDGLRHGQDYKVKLKAGLPGQDGSTLGSDVEVGVRVPDRQPRLSFAGKGTLLPLRNGVGLPLSSVNLAMASLRIYRIGERNLLQQLDLQVFGEALNQWGEDRLRETAGQELFRGKVHLAPQRNEETTTAIPLADILPALEPGLYAAVAEPADGGTEPWEARATQWFTVSDIGLQTFTGAHGTTIIARSLATALPLAGVQLRLLARNNETLLDLLTDVDGRATIGAAQLRGKGGQEARLLIAGRTTGELTFLELDRPGLDLVELGVDGRPPPGPLDAFLWTERGIYRPGETVHLAAMLRDREASAVADMPLGLRLLRPDLVEVRRLNLPGSALAAGKLTIEVPANAYSGLWTVTAHVGEATTAIGRTQFLVQDFVPPRLEVALAATDARPPAAGPITVGIDARYLYGAAAGGLTGEAELVVRAAPAPLTEAEGWSFGLVQEPFLQQAAAPVSFTTDEQGKATVALAPEQLQETTHPLAAVVRARVFDIDGRPTGNELELPLDTAQRFIGIRPTFKGGLPEGAKAGFRVKLVDGQGRPAAPLPLSWMLVAEDWDYVWFERHGRWQYESVVHDRRVAGGELALGVDGEAGLEVEVESGRYRLELFESEAITATSVRFTAGWWATGEASDRPEKLDVTVEPVGPSGTIRAMVAVSFPARVTVALADDAIRAIHEVALPAGGGMVELPATAVGPGGAYVLVTAVSPTGAVLPRLPVRAGGAAWVPGPLAERRLDLAIEAPSTMEPGRALPVTVRLADPVPGQKVQLTLAMVDDAILQMTAFAAPDPTEHYLGRRALGLELRDVYGRLIDPAGQPGRVVSGGDQRLALQAAGIDVKTYKTVATMSEILETGADGTVHTSLEVPEFSGRLRLMAVAWSTDRVGHAEAVTTIRPMMLAELTRPRFLAPGDRADIRFRLTNLAAPEADYEVSLVTEGPLQLDRERLTFKNVLLDKGRFAPLALTAGSEPGTGRIRVTVQGAQGVVAEQEIELAVRAPQPWLTRRQLLTLEPGKSLGLGSALAADLIRGTATGELTLSAVPAFDVPGLLSDLDRYPYGCAEQTVSRAMPHLYVSRLQGQDAAGSGAAERAIGRLANLEGTRGGFSPWSPRNEQEYWLTAYVADFLGQAKAARLPVPDGLEDRTLRWLAKRFAGPQETTADIAASAYAGLVLAKAGRMDLSRLRYLALRNMDKLPSDAARVQLAGALLHLGERELGQKVAGALGQGRLVDRRKPLLDYGTSLRDEAIVLATATESGLRQKDELLGLAERAARAAAEARYLGTQEQAWLIRAAAALAEGSTGIEAQLGADVISSRGPVTRSLALEGNEPQTLENRAAAALYVALGVTGIPSEAGPAVANGFEIQRRYLTTKGQLAQLGRLRQNDQLVVLIEGRATEPGFRRALVVDLLPAGLELENLELKGSPEIDQFAWLGELAVPEHLALQDDRFVASLDLDQDEARFRLAYLVRAITPGSFTLPGVQVEDMIEPGFHARSAAGRLTVTAR